MENVRERLHNLKFKPDMSLLEKKKQEDEILAQERKKQIEKITKYASYVKKMYYPKISEDKKMEIEQKKHIYSNPRMDLNPSSSIIRLDKHGISIDAAGSP